jgi:hypothetical protein
MRVSSLSDPRVVELVSKYFVPAWVSRDFYQLEGDHQAEKQEVARLDGDRARRHLKGGTVCVFIITDKGDVLDTMPVLQAMKPENLTPFLEKIVAEQKVKPRSEEAIRESAAKPVTPKPKTEGGRFIHVFTHLDTGGNRSVTNDRVELTAAQWKKFLPPADAKPGTSWEIPEETAHKLLQYCYPPVSDWRAKDSKVMKGTLKATFAAQFGDEARIKLEGELELRFPVGKPTEGRITTHFDGAARADCKKQTLASLALVSENAEYVWTWQGKPQPRKMRIALELEP